MDAKSVEREILRLPESPKMDSELIALLTDLCFHKSKLLSGDTLFVFGSNIMHKQLGELINKIVESTLIKNLIITGGIANYNNSIYHNESESELIVKQLSIDVLKKTKTILESTSKNTLENVTHSLNLFDFNSCSNIVFIAHSYSTMRSYLTLKTFMPNVKLVSQPLNIFSDNPEFPVDILNWHKTKYGSSLVWGEYLRFQSYGKRGDFIITPVQELLNKIESKIKNLI